MLLISAPAAADPDPAQPAPEPAAQSPAAAPAPTSVASVTRPRGDESVVQPEPTPKPDRGLTAADVASAPLPGEESGRVDKVSDGDSTGRMIGRGILFLPRYAVDLVLTVPRTGLWATERYQLIDRYDQIFYNDAKTIGLYPTISVDTSLGVTAGAGFVHKDLFGAHEKLSAQAVLSNRYRQIYSVGLTTGDRLGSHFALELDAGYERRPDDRFFGIGNGDKVDDAPPGQPPIDPLVDDTAVEARYRQARSRARVTADLKPTEHLHVRPAGELSKLTFGTSDRGEPIETIYNPDGLVGFDGISYGYAELELRWDSRRRSTPFEPPAVFSQGGLVSAFGGLVNRIDNGPDFWRYGVDLQKYFKLGEGPRVLVTHFHGEAVTGRRDEVPFTELPKLGGPLYLRGYDLDQFRDRVAAFGSVAYKWDLSQWVSANLFTDVGRVFPSMSDLTTKGMRVGYGIGLEGHSLDSFLMEVSLASSIDGGLFLNLSFNPVYDLDERVRRR
jgi:hypothetical protein